MDIKLTVTVDEADLRKLLRRPGGKAKAATAASAERNVPEKGRALYARTLYTKDSRGNRADVLVTYSWGKHTVEQLLRRAYDRRPHDQTPTDVWMLAHANRKCYVEHQAR